VAAKFKPGDRVRVMANPAARGHVRTPGYLQGKIGSVEGIHGAFRNPESLAYGGDGLPKQFLYLVRFDQVRLWEKYGGSSQDRLLVDIYEHWLEPG